MIPAVIAPERLPLLRAAPPPRQAVRALSDKTWKNENPCGVTRLILTARINRAEPEK